jgi:hypothetical protein
MPFFGKDGSHNPLGERVHPGGVMAPAREADTVRGRHPRTSAAAICSVALLLASPAPAQDKTSAPGGALTVSHFQAITYAELEKLPTSGCSFSLSRGTETIAFWDTQEKPADKPRFWFKIDGRLTKVPGIATKSASLQSVGVWTGKVAGYDLRIIEGRIDPTFKNDGDGVAGDGRIEWPGGAMAVRWLSGC